MAPANYERGFRRPFAVEGSVWGGPFGDRAGLAVGEEGAVVGDVGNDFVNWLGGIWEDARRVEGLGGGLERVEAWRKEVAALMCE